jgi:2-polyprenyl-3-methyl-5-hydroxy-6-metoxy-1,4-benzoquinol methylase
MLIVPEDIKRDRLISPEYLSQQKQLHENPDYGVASQHFAPVVAKVMNQYGVQELLDYGAGKGRLAQTLMQKQMVNHPFRVQHYEPTHTEWADIPEPTEMVACIDVLEHIEPELLDNVLDDLQRCTLSIGMFSVSTEPALKTLPDGRNAHLIIKPSAWWLPRIQERFDLHIFQKTPDGFFVVVMANEVQNG